MESTESALEVSGEEVRQRMRRQGVTVQQLAAEAGLPAPEVSNMLNGRTWPGAERLARLEAAMARLHLDRVDRRFLPPMPRFRIKPADESE